MKILEPRALRQTADGILQEQGSLSRQLILIHTGAAAVLSIVLLLVHEILDRQIGNTGGLAGMELRSILTTVQTVLQIAQAILTPLWGMGYIMTILRLLRREEVTPRSLLGGFSRVGPVIRLELLTGLISFFLVMLCSYIAAFVFDMTPWARPIMEAMMPLMEDAALMEDPEALAAAMEEVLAGISLEQYGLPLMGVFALVIVAVAVPMLYKFRMAVFALAEEPRLGAMGALRVSTMLMKGQRLALLKVDLGFWWFYALQALALAVSFADAIAALLGVSLPLEGTALYVVCFITGLAIETALFIWQKNRVQLTYAAAYEALKMPREEKQPGKQPWNYA